jgi:hypothetical protein
MHEWIPILLSFCLGACWRLPAARPLSIALAAVGIFLIALTAFVISGEYSLGWTYFLLDLTQSFLGFIAGVVMVRAIRRQPVFPRMK